MGNTNNYSACPISTNRVDERVVRTVALFTTILLITYILGGYKFIPALLFVDFLLRSLGGKLKTLSPLAAVAKRVVSIVFAKKAPKLINAGPKLFATKMGVGFSTLLVLFQISCIDTTIVSIVVATMFAVASFLEAAFAVCLGCYIYQYLQRFKNNEFLGGTGI
jgi:hypothetical protein